VDRVDRVRRFVLIIVGAIDALQGLVAIVKDD